MKNQHYQNNFALEAILAKMADLVDFQGVKPSGVHDKSILGDTPLHFVAVWGDVLAGKVLLDAGADPNSRGENGYTPLHNARSKAF
jgi:ankyrin repeat protein